MASPTKAAETKKSSAIPPLGAEHTHAIAREGTHEFVQQLLEAQPRGRVLDVPAGRGAMSRWLGDHGFEVTACDLYPDLFEAPGVEIHRADLNQRLPFANGAFDYVVCIEGLEHLENPKQAVREFTRVLRPGGRVIITVPNILNIEERVKNLLHGYTSHFKPISRAHLDQRRRDFAGWREQVGELDEVFLHIHPLSYPELRFILESSGFDGVEVFRDRPKPRQWLYFPLVWLVRLLGALRPAAEKEARWTRELCSDAVLLGGNSIVVRATRI
jgi:SAM-dependent methyltransferase